MKDDDILGELCADTFSDVSDNSDSEISESDSDVPTTISTKESRHFPLVFNRDSKTNTEEEDRKVRVCGTMRPNRGILRDLEREASQLKRRQSAFWRKGDVMVQARKGKRLAMISKMHDATLGNTRKKNKPVNKENLRHFAAQ
jgi:hypothetical protein